MIYKSQSKGVSPVIGFILILGVLVIFLSWYQVVQAPNMNQNVESTQDEETVGDLLGYKSSYYDVLYNNDTLSDSIVIDNIVSYPIQPVQPSDTYGLVSFNRVKNPYNIENTDNSKITIKEPIQTSRLEYKTAYIELSNRDYKVENGLIVDNVSTSNSDIIRGNQIIIESNNIRIYSLESNLFSIKVPNPELKITSESIVNKTITKDDIDDTSKPLALEIKSNISKSDWVDILEPSNSEYITGIKNHSGDNHDIIIQLDQNKEYNLIKSKGYISAS